MKDFKFIFFGVRGSYTVSNKHVAKYGGNTASVLVESDNRVIILDAGTGLITAGNYLLQNKPKLKKIDIFISHLHIDHIQGIPFFEPVFDPQFEINFYCNESPKAPLEKTIFSLFNLPLSPIGNEGIKAKINFNILDVDLKKTVHIDKTFAVDFIKENHPISGVLIYRVSVGKKFIVYATDVESPNGFSPETTAFISGADVLIHDSMYFDHDYYSPHHPTAGYGHSTVTMAVQNAIRCAVNKLFLFHYNPNYSDTDVEKMRDEAREKFPGTYLSEELEQFSIK